MTTPRCLQKQSLLQGVLWNWKNRPGTNPRRSNNKFELNHLCQALMRWFQAVVVVSCCWFHGTWVNHCILGLLKPKEYVVIAKKIENDPYCGILWPALVTYYIEGIPTNYGVDLCLAEIVVSVTWVSRCVVGADYDSVDHDHHWIIKETIAKYHEIIIESW